ncbi:ComEC/Rec2 family competence protein [Mesorhizobium sp. CN5-321]|uniref:ComEC/Rec2 family competence protein n=1 Tax=Mesorhizobium hunchu TaxID=3157708 RepID=UPI0032B737F6
MTGRGRSADAQARGAQALSERTLFAPGKPGDALPEAVPGARPASPSSEKPASPEPLRPPDVGIVGRLVRRRRGFSLVALVAAAGRDAELELDRGLAFLLVPVFLAAGAVFYFSLSLEPGWFRPLAVASALALLAVATAHRRAIHLACMAAFLVAAGLLLAKFETWRAAGTTLGAEISTHVTGRVVSIDDLASGRVRLTLDVISTARPKLRYQPQRIRLSARAVGGGIVPGATVTGYARLLPPTGPVRPEGYDFSFESYFGGLGASGFFLGTPKPVAGKPVPLRARAWAAVEDFRDIVADRVRSSIGGPEGEIAAALIVGVRAGIPDAINEAMRKTGIYHIISISGLHMALVAGTVMALMRGAFALFPGFSSRRPVKKYAAAAALFAIAAYLLISGIVVAAERSFIMLAVMLLAVLFDRAALTMRNLAISAIIVIVASPHEVVGPSFQMSFAATAALVGAYAAWANRNAGRTSGPPPQRSASARVARKLAGGVGGAAMTSIVAGCATTLYAVWHFQRVAPLSLFANLAVMPITSLIVMPFAVFSAILMPFGLDYPFLWVMGKGLAAMIAISEAIAAHSPLDGVGLISGRSVLFVTVALIVGTMATTRLRMAALPFALAGLMTIHQVRLPDALVSEDARLVALPIGGGELAASRNRPNEFTIDNWRRALDAEAVVLPEKPMGEDARFAFDSPLDLPSGTPFLCGDDLCLARHASGAIVATARTAKAARRACAYASLIVIADATARDPCHDTLVAVITARDLARRGSAAIYFAKAADTQPTILFAVEQDYRPWHMQRKFSREARGLGPYQPRRPYQQSKSRKRSR